MPNAETNPELNPAPLPPEVIEYVVDESSEHYLTLEGLSRVYERAYADLNEQHPEWFITYRQPRNPKEKLALRNKASKIASRQRKLHYAVAAKFDEWGIYTVEEEIAIGIEMYSETASV